MPKGLSKAMLQCKRLNLVANFGTNAIWWPNLQPIQVVPLKSILNFFWMKDLFKLWTEYPGSVVPLAMFKGTPKEELGFPKASQ